MLGKGKAADCEWGIQNKSQLIKQKATMPAQHHDDDVEGDDDVVVDCDANNKYRHNG